MTPAELRAARKRLGLTQQGMAKKILMTRDSIASMETGRKPIMPRTEKLVRALLSEYTMKL